MTAHLSCEGVTVRFGGVVACDQLSLEVPEGKIIGLIGPNGAGKTTLFNVLSGFQPYSTGTLRLYGESIDHKPPHEMVRLGMARTFQNINLFGEQTTLDNMLIGGHALVGNPWSAMLWLPGARKRERELVQRAEEIADMLGLTSELDNQVKNLPYGHRKRVELGRALAAQPRLIMLDEPVAGCNEEETEELQDCVTAINRDMGVTILLVEHDMSMVMKVCDYIYVINFGANLAEGTPAEIRSNSEVIAAYLGDEEDGA